MGRLLTATFWSLPVISRFCCKILLLLFYVLCVPVIGVIKFMLKAFCLILK